MPTGAGGKLAAGGFAAAERGGDAGEIEPEHVVQQERGALQRRQPFEDEHQGDGEVVREVVSRVGIEHLIHRRFRQPLADIDFMACLGGLQPIEAQPRHYRTEVAARLFDRSGIDRVPAQVASCTTSSASAREPRAMAYFTVGKMRRR